MIRVDEVAECLGCAPALAYKIIRQLNDELKKKGYITIAGRVPRSYFEERCYLTSKGQNADQ
jgi:hypothetical protein